MYDSNVEYPILQSNICANKENALGQLKAAGDLRR